MIYLLYGDQELMIKKRIAKIAKEELTNVDEINYVLLDAEESSLYNIIDEASSLPLGYDKKVVSVTKCFFLGKEYKVPRSMKDSFDNQLEELSKYLANPSDDTCLILTYEKNDINKESGIYKLIESKGKILEFLETNDTDWANYVRQYFKVKLNVEIDENAIDELISRTNKDLGSFTNEANKLALYTSHITYKDVDTLIRKPLDQNVFQIFDALLKEDNKRAISIFRDLQKEQPTEPAVLIATLVGQFRVLYQVSFLTRRGLSSMEISKELGISEPRVRMNKRYTYSLSLLKIHEILEELYKQDCNIKSGQSIDRFYDFELFLTRFTLQ